MIKLLQKCIAIAILTTSVSACAMGEPDFYGIARNGEDEIIYLIKHGYDINNDFEVNGQHGTMLHWAARRGMIKVLDCIKAKFPEVNMNSAITADIAGDTNGLTPQFLACRNGKIRVLDWYKKNSVDHMNNNPNPAITDGKYKGWTMLHSAAATGQTAVLDWYKANFPDLMNSNPNPAITDGEDEGSTVLHIATAYGNPEIFDWYYKNYPGINLNPSAPDGETPLSLAATMEQSEGIKIIEWFAQHKFNLDREKESSFFQGATALEICALNNHIDRARYLVFLGARLKRSLQLASRAQNPTMQQYLEQTAKTTQLVLCSCRALYLFVDEYKSQFPSNQAHQSEEESAQEPPAKKCRTSAPLVNPTYDTLHLNFLKRVLESFGVIKYFLKFGPEIDAPVINGRQLCADTPLHWIANTFFGDPKLDEPVLRLINWLIETKHANINAINLDGNTPLAVACAQGNRILVQFLLEHGADPSIGNNPLVIALENNTHSKIFPIFQNTMWGLAELNQPKK